LTQLLRAQTPGSVREQVSAWRSAGQRIALVPTMGNLHDGHLSLIRIAAEHADRVVCSIFVNPTQFGPSEDIASYPRTPEADDALLAEQGIVDLLFVPSEDDIYPHGLNGSVVVNLPALVGELCGRSRPGHFNGVASVVLRLLNIVTPDVLVVGRKDYQQAILLARMIRDLHLPVEILLGDTVREADGLAMSSRNQYLTPAEREVAGTLHAVLQELAVQLRNGGASIDKLAPRAREQLVSAGFKPDYIELRRARELGAVTSKLPDEPLILLGAAWLGRARLIDNVPV
jgi:pantoate--beta-alanine ligase